MKDAPDPVLKDDSDLSDRSYKDAGNPAGSESFQDFECLLMKMDTQP